MLILKNLTKLTKPKPFPQLYIKSNFSTTPPPNHYQTLSLSPQASFQQIKQKFRQLSKVYHPDHYKGEQQKFHQIQKAYKVLSDSRTRKQHDVSLGIMKSVWESEEFGLRSDKFEDEVFEQVLKSDQGRKVNEGKTLEQKLYQKFQKEINQQMSSKQKVKVLFWPCLVFGLFWTTWNIFESIIINYQGSQSHQVKAYIGEKRLSAIPIKIG